MIKIIHTTCRIISAFGIQYSTLRNATHTSFGLKVKTNGKRRMTQPNWDPLPLHGEHDIAEEVRPAELC